MNPKPIEMPMSTMPWMCCPLGCFSFLAHQVQAAKRPPASKKPESQPRSQGLGRAPAAWGGRKYSLSEFTRALGKSVELETWDDERFQCESKLQDAERNFGQVMLMVDTQADNGGFRGRYPGEFARVAVKQMPNIWVQHSSSSFALIHPKSVEQPWQDIACVRHLNAVNYPFACRLLAVFQDERSTYVTMSLAQEGDLFNWCQLDPPPGPERLRVIFPVVVQILIAVKWLHEIGIVHSDISLENILLAEPEEWGAPSQVKLCDFGMSTLRRFRRREPCGKPSYVAPEMHTEEEYDGFLTDVFAIGVTVFSMATNDYPWFDTRPGECRYFGYIQKHGLRKFAENRAQRRTEKDEVLMELFNRPLFELVEGLVHLDASKRTTLGEENWAAGSKNGTAPTSVWDYTWMRGSAKAATAIEAVELLQKQQPAPCKVMAEANDANDVYKTHEVAEAMAEANDAKDLYNTHKGTSSNVVSVPNCRHCTQAFKA